MAEKLTGEALEKALSDRGLPSTGSADEKRAAVEQFDAGSTGTGADPAEAPSGDDLFPAPAGEDGKHKHSDPPPRQTTLDTHNTAPSVTVPGDGPADTTDPTERASTVGGDKAAAAVAGHGTVNAAIPLPKIPSPPANEEGHRIERYPATRPDGSVVTVTHNIDTGQTWIGES